MIEGDKEVLRTHFQYFSFTVLTTVGFGNIVPVHPLARMAVVLEGVVGQLFPAILIARPFPFKSSRSRKDRARGKSVIEKISDFFYKSVTLVEGGVYHDP